MMITYISDIYVQQKVVIIVLLVEIQNTFPSNLDIYILCKSQPEVHYILG